MEYLYRLKVTGDGGWLDGAVASGKSNVTELEAIENDLNSRYQAYDGEIAAYGVKPAITCFPNTKQNKLLINYYEHPPVNLKKYIQNRRNDHCIEECPYCGKPTVPDTLDHFIPKDDWPDYSIYPNNLVPQCRTCASTKGSSYFCDSQNRALFISPIYSDLISKVGFEIEVSFDTASATTFFKPHYKIPSGLRLVEKARIKSHFIELKINSKVLNFLDREYKRLVRICSKTPTNIRLILEARVEETNAKGAISGDWKTAMYKGILSSRDVLDHLSGLSGTRSVNQSTGSTETLSLE